MTGRPGMANWVKCEVVKRNLFEYGEFTCEYCFEVIDSKDIEFDHMHPVNYGGESIPSNIAIACSKCNAKKSDKLYDTFIASIKNYVRLSDRAHLKEFFGKPIKRRPHV
jgi:5-methylcytosine-specific restriction endonuclease McrA